MIITKNIFKKSKLKESKWLMIKHINQPQILDYLIQ